MTDDRLDRLAELLRERPHWRMTGGDLADLIDQSAEPEPAEFWIGPFPWAGGDKPPLPLGVPVRIQRQCDTEMGGDAYPAAAWRWEHWSEFDIVSFSYRADNTEGWIPRPQGWVPPDEALPMLMRFKGGLEDEFSHIPSLIECVTHIRLLPREAKPKKVFQRGTVTVDSDDRLLFEPEPATSPPSDVVLKPCKCGGKARGPIEDAGRDCIDIDVTVECSECGWMYRETAHRYGQADIAKLRASVMAAWNVASVAGSAPDVVREALERTAAYFDGDTWASERDTRAGISRALAALDARETETLGYALLHCDGTLSVTMKKELTHDFYEFRDRMAPNSRIVRLVAVEGKP